MGTGLEKRRPAAVIDAATFPSRLPNRERLNGGTLLIVRADLMLKHVAEGKQHGGLDYL